MDIAREIKHIIDLIGCRTAEHDAGLRVNTRLPSARLVALILGYAHEQGGWSRAEFAQLVAVVSGIEFVFDARADWYYFPALGAPNSDEASAAAELRGAPSIK